MERSSCQLQASLQWRCGDAAAWQSIPMAQETQPLLTVTLDHICCKEDHPDAQTAATLQVLALLSSCLSIVHGLAADGRIDEASTCMVWCRQ